MSELPWSWGFPFPFWDFPYSANYRDRDGLHRGGRSAGRYRASRPAQALGLYGLSALATHAIAPSVGEIVIDAGGFSALFALSIAYSVLGFGLASRIIDKSLEYGITRGEGSLWKLFITPRFSQIFLIGFVMGATLGTVSTYIPTYIRSRGIQWISLFYITSTLTAIIVRIVLERVPDRIGHERMLTPAFGGLVIAVVLLSQAQTQWMFALSGVFNDASHGTLYPVTNALALNRAGRENAGRAQSLYGASFSVGMTVWVFHNGNLVDFFGYSVMFLGMGGWILIALSAFYGWSTAGRRFHRGSIIDDHQYLVIFSNFHLYIVFFLDNMSKERLGFF